MTVKELKEKLELLIEDGKEDYTVFAIDYSDEILVDVNDTDGEVYL